MHIYVSILLLDRLLVSFVIEIEQRLVSKSRPHVVTRQCLSAGWCGVRGAICVMYLSRIEATYNGPK